MALHRETIACSAMRCTWSRSRNRAQGLAPVLVHARTDQAGKFSVEAPVSYTARRWRSPLVLFATSATARAIRRLPIVLGPGPIPCDDHARSRPGDRAERGRPARQAGCGANVLPVTVDDVPIPDVVAQALGGTTDSRGRVAMGAFPKTAIQEVRVEASGFGTQRLRVDEADSSDGKDHSARIALAPVGRVVGRLVPPGNEPIKGVTRSSNDAGRRLRGLRPRRHGGGCR